MKHRVLLVDDEDKILQTLSRQLRTEDYELLTATSGAEALALLEKGPVSVVLSDLRMPEMDGVTFLQKASEVCPNAIRMVLSAHMEARTVLSAINEGQIWRYITKPWRQQDLLITIRNALALFQSQSEIRRLVGELQDKNQALSQANEKLEQISLTDALTGVANRRCFDDTYDREWKRACRNDTGLTIVLIDIDHFKKYNDRYGHQQGDECLKQVAAALRKVCKRPSDLVARYGGEEFILLCPETYDARNMGERCRRAVEELQITHPDAGGAGVVTVSVGAISVIPQGDDDPDEGVRKADQALYRAKENGRNRVM